MISGKTEPGTPFVGRRDMILGMVAGAAVFTMPFVMPAITKPAAPDPIDVIIRKVTEDIRRYAPQSELPLQRAWDKEANLWASTKDLRAMVERRVAKLFENLSGPALQPDGRLSYEIQDRVHEHLFVDRYLYPDFWQALVACIPPHLR